MDKFSHAGPVYRNTFILEYLLLLNCNQTTEVPQRCILTRDCKITKVVHWRDYDPEPIHIPGVTAQFIGHPYGVVAEVERAVLFAQIEREVSEIGKQHFVDVNHIIARVYSEIREAVESPEVPQNRDSYGLLKWLADRRLFPDKRLPAGKGKTAFARAPMGDDRKQLLDELVQCVAQALLDDWENAATDGGNLPGWLYRVALRHWFDYYYKPEYRNLSRLVDLPEATGELLADERGRSRSEFLMDVEKAVCTIEPPAVREVCRLFLHGDCNTWDEIAAEFGIPKEKRKHFHQQMERGYGAELEKLRNALKPYQKWRGFEMPHTRFREDS